MPIENYMKTPKRYVGQTGVLSKGLAIIIVLYIVMGLSGYLAYGDVIKSAITLNMQINNATDEM